MLVSLHTAVERKGEGGRWHAGFYLYCRAECRVNL